MSSRPASWLAFVLVPGLACAGLHTEPLPILPARPVLSADTGTAAEGSVELEGGALLAPDDFFTMPAQIKWGAGPSTELFALMAPYHRHLEPGPDPEGASDLFLGVRHRFLEETRERPSAAFQLTTKLPIGDPDLDSTGEVDAFLAGILTKTVERAAITAYYQIGMLSQPDRNDTNLHHTLALAASRYLSSDFYGIGELSLLLEPELDHEVGLATLALGFFVSDEWVLDAGFARGLTEDAPDWTLFMGFTLGQLR